MSHSPLSKLMGESRKKLIPLTALFELTYGCNLKCKYCYITKQKKRELSTAEIKKILSQLADAGCLYLTMSGGELFTRKDAVEIIKYARKKHFAVTVFTNGTLIDEGLAQKLVPLALQEIGITFWGAGPQTHDRITGVRGSFRKSLEAVKLLKSKGIRVVIKSTLTSENLAQYPGIIKLAKSAGCEFSFDPVVTGSAAHPKKNLKYRLNRRQLKKLFSDKRVYPQSHVYGKPVRPSAQKKTSPPVCDAGISFLSISAYADVYPCVQLPLKMGNLRNNSLKKIWKSKKFTYLREAMPMLSVSCASCRFVDQCTRCPGLALSEEGDMIGPSHIACEIAKAVQDIRK